MLVCASVSAASEWYQRVVGLESAHGGDEYEMLTSDGAVVLQLHDDDPDEHEQLSHPGRPRDGNGVAIWFESSDYTTDLARIREARTGGPVDIVDDDHVNELANHREIWLRDLDGYLVVISSAYGIL